MFKYRKFISSSGNSKYISSFSPFFDSIENTVIYFLTVIDSLSYYKIVYPNIYSNKVNADSFYTKLINFVYKNN